MFTITELAIIRQALRESARVRSDVGAGRGVAFQAPHERDRAAHRRISADMFALAERVADHIAIEPIPPPPVSDDLTSQSYSSETYADALRRRLAGN